jgi:peptidoglycan hydrolase-like protein with peptidoglycan-binding domain
MNSRFDLEAFDSHPLNHKEEEFGSQFSDYEEEEEEEVKRSMGRSIPARRSSGALRPTVGRKSIVARKYAGGGKPQSGKRPKRPIKLPVIRPLPFPAWPSIRLGPLLQDPRQDSAPSGGPQQPRQDSMPSGSPQQPRQDSAPSGGPQPPPERPERVDDDQAREGNERIRWIQVSLNNLLQLDLPIDGIMRAATRAAVRRFQRRENLPVTGIVGPDTEQALVAATRGVAGTKTNGASADTMTNGGADQEVPWLSSVFPGLTEFEFEPQELPTEFETGSFGDFEATGVCPSFTPVAAEKPGGGRVKNKTAPRAGDIVRVKRAFSGEVPLHRLAAKALNAMQCAARADGIKAPLLQPTSGFRDPAHQARLWANALKKYGSPEEARKWVAPPGGSAHQSGRAVDLYLGGKNSSANVANLRASPAYRWLVVNAHRFGFYPYEREPWHWEYNPPASRQSKISYEFPEFEEEFEDEGIGPTQEWGQEQEWGGITGRFSRWGAPSTSSAQPSHSSASALRARAVALANQELIRWGKGTIKESDPKLRPVIESYWRNGPGYKPSQANWWTAVPWSAAFISWLMRKAGAGADFKYSGAHAAYIAAAKRNRLANNNNPFKAYRLREVKPRVGDLVCKKRSGSGATYDNIAPGMATHCDIVTAVEPNRLITVGGNVSNSVKQTIVTTDANGFINKPGYFAVIKVGA